MNGPQDLGGRHGFGSVVPEEEHVRFHADWGRRVIGLDAAPAMIEMCRARFPDQAWIVGDMRKLDLSEPVDGIIGWDSFFHLNPIEQRQCLQSFVDVLKPGGALMLTIGHIPGEVIGYIGDEEVYHSSLSMEEYTSILKSGGMAEVEIDVNADTNRKTVLMAHAKTLSDADYMDMALDLADAQKGRTAPNPSVGCVLVKNGRVIGQGATADGGRPHAETVALQVAGRQAKGATAYVTLEPCSHYGQTGPCANALIEAGIARCVIAVIDPDPRVHWRGAALLQEAGIDTVIGEGAERAFMQNSDFFARFK